jgi:hypothetical protein
MLEEPRRQSALALVLYPREICEKQTSSQL